MEITNVVYERDGVRWGRVSVVSGESQSAARLPWEQSSAGAQSVRGVKVET